MKWHSDRRRDDLRTAGEGALPFELLVSHRVPLEWHRLACADRGRIFDYIEAEDPRVAVDIDMRFDAPLHD